MSFLQSLILGSTSFLLGLIFVCQIIDIPLLYHQTLAPDALQSAYDFYTLWYDAPKVVKGVLHAAAGIPLLAIVGKLHGWNESAKFFDGSSLVLHMAIIIIYLTIHIPSLPIFGTLPSRSLISPFFTLTFSPLDSPRIHNIHSQINLPLPPSHLSSFIKIATPPAGGYTDEIKVESVRVLSAGNALIGLCLIGIILMQAGQAYAATQEEAEQRKLDRRTVRTAGVAQEGEKVAGGKEGKKDQ